MEQVTARFLAEIRKSHRIHSYVEVISPTNVTIQLPATDGSIQVDNDAAVRRRCSITCIDPDGTLTPETQESVLTPYGTTIKPYRGVMYADGTTEVVQLGVFRLAKVNIRDSLGGSPVISLEAYDLARTISRDKFIEPYVIAVGTNVIDAIKAIVERTLDEVDYDATSSTVTTSIAKVYDVGNDPWGACLDLAQSAGCEIYFGATGWLHIAPPREIDSLPSADFTYIEGPTCTMLDLERVYTDEPGFNGVVVTGESPGDELPPVRAIAWDTEPSSVTYHLGPYGEVPMFVTDQNVKTAEQAQAMADSLLQQQLGFSSQLSLTSMVNPALESGDVVEVVRERTHVSGLYALDSFSIPLGVSGTQSLTVRQKRTVA